MRRLQLCSHILLNNRLCKNYKYANSELCYIHYILNFQDNLERLFIFMVSLCIIIFINYSIIVDFELINFE